MRVMVTGGGGFIGSHLVKSLIEQHSCDVLVIDKLTYAGDFSSLESVKRRSKLRTIQADICDGQRVKVEVDAFQPDAIIHLAAESHVDRSIDGPEEFVQTNLVGTFRLLQVAQRYFEARSAESRSRFRFVHGSTDEVYGSLGFDELAFTEVTPYDPHSPYAASKAGSDHLAKAWFHTYGLPVIVTNCSNNYGPYQFPEKLVPVAILHAITGQPIPVYGTGKNVRDWLFVGDHVDALYEVLKKGRPGQSYNIGGNNEVDNLSLVKRICGLLDQARPAETNIVAQKARPGLKRYEELIVFVPDRPGHDIRYAIDASKLRSEIGWQPGNNFAKCLSATVDWYLDNETWWQPILARSRA